jgi:GNAT superfamily N-acetyltransferase
VLIDPRTIEDDTLRWMVVEQQRELAALEGVTHISFPLHDGIEYLVGLLDERIVACGALQPLEAGVAEVKRMYVLPEYRGRGLSRLLLAAVEQKARDEGIHTLRLETGRFLDPALGLYTSSGYSEIPLYGQYVGHVTSICFEKRL